MRMIIKPTDDFFDTVMVDILDIRKMYLSEYGLTIELNDLFGNLRVVEIDVCKSDYEIDIEE